MAFNLEKTDEPKKSKFDLSKSDETKPDFQEPKKNNTLIIIIVLAVVGIGGYFFMKSSSKETTESAVAATSDSASLASTDSSAAPADTTAATASDPTSNTSAPTVSAPTTFKQGSADVVSVDDSKVSQVLDYLKSNASAVVTIEGYASSEGDAAFNDRLSQARASNFLKYLVSKGVKAENIKAVGKGIENPVASNDDEAGRSQNRRVEIKF
jgi:outer membrane protein OmpA-like peptidoglycan-associated protein